MTTTTERALLDCLNLLMDMDAEGRPHSDLCDCDSCLFVDRAKTLTIQYEPLWKRLQGEIAK